MKGPATLSGCRDFHKYSAGIPGNHNEMSGHPRIIVRDGKPDDRIGVGDALVAIECPKDIDLPANKRNDGIGVIDDKNPRVRAA